MLSTSVADDSFKPHPLISEPNEDAIVQQAIALLERRIFHAGPMLNSPHALREYLRLKLAAGPNETFSAVFLTDQLQVIAHEIISTGTINAATVYPRVLVQRCLVHNCSCLVIAHQHPSGGTTPSLADRALTKRLREILDVIDVRLLDHFVIGRGEPFSFANAGWL